MTLPQNYKLGLLNLLYLLINSDDEISDTELNYLEEVRDHEHIDDELFQAFRTSLNNKAEQDIFQDGIDLINQCSHQLKMRAFIILYRTAQADGSVHPKEVRLLLYSSKLSKMDIAEVISIASDANFTYNKLEQVL